MPNQPFDWVQYLNLAKELAAREEESCLRSSISRAYYCVFNLASNRAAQNGFVFAPGESTHAQLWRLYNRNPDPECMKLGQIALRLKEKREKADYKPAYPRIQDEVPQVLAAAEDFAKILGNIAQRLPRPESMRR
jgi:uncharacterized protein (UPF0332 family)